MFLVVILAVGVVAVFLKTRSTLVGQPPAEPDDNNNNNNGGDENHNHNHIEPLLYYRDVFCDDVLLQRELEKIDIYEKADYIRAIVEVPHLVRRESDPSRFLRVANYNYSCAAMALVQYWKRRCEIFKERALLPLILSGDGALSKEDIDFLMTGICVLLKPDSEGRTVVCFDSSRRLDHELDVRLRCCFWLGQIVSENDLSQTLGFIVLVIMSEPKHDEFTSTVVNTFLNTFPIKVKEFHVFQCVPGWARTNTLRRWILSTIRVVKSLLRNHKVYLHAERNEVMMAEMAEHGFPRDDLPRCIGGRWNYEHFFLWFFERARQDRLQYPFLTS